LQRYFFTPFRTEDDKDDDEEEEEKTGRISRGGSIGFRWYTTTFCPSVGKGLLIEEPALVQIKSAKVGTGQQCTSPPFTTTSPYSQQANRNKREDSCWVEDHFYLCKRKMEDTKDENALPLY
jgi:hypothetical protein